MAFVTPVVEHWLEREIAQWVHHEGSIRRVLEEPLSFNITKLMVRNEVQQMIYFFQARKLKEAVLVLTLSLLSPV